MEDASKSVRPQDHFDEWMKTAKLDPLVPGAVTEIMQSGISGVQVDDALKLKYKAKDANLSVYICATTVPPPPSSDLIPTTSLVGSAHPSICEPTLP
jgi:hypothetical protein